MRLVVLALLIGCSSPAKPVVDRGEAPAAPPAAVATPTPVTVAPPPTTFADAQRRLVPAQCDRKVRCGEIGAADRKACLADPEDAKTMGYGPDWQRRTTDSIGLGRVRFDPARFADCVAAVEGPCITALERFPSSRCKLLAPNVMPGGACTDWGECIDGFCTAQIGCTGHCVARKPLGESCGNDELCVETAFCDRGASGFGPNTCATKKPVGEKCREWDSCQAGLQCLGFHMVREEPGAPEEEQLGTCTAPGVAGVACRPAYHGDCAVGFACDFATSTCLARPARGQPCRSPDSCAEGLTCAGLEAMWQPNTSQWRVGTPGTCVPPLDVGSTCDVFASVYATGCPGTTACDPKTATCIHAALAGSPCEPNGGCRGNLYCHPTSKTCTARLAFGAACTPAGDDRNAADDPCSLGKCDAKRRVCVPLQACGKP